MKRRIFAIAFALLTLPAMIFAASAASAAAGTKPLESLINVTQCIYNGGNISAPGSTAIFRITVEFPATVYDETSGGVHADGSLTMEQLKVMELSMGPGSSFGFRSGVLVYKPFTISVPEPPDPPAATVTTTFSIELVYTGAGNNLVLLMTHPTIAGSTPDTASTSWSFFIRETIPVQPVETPQPDPPDYGATPRLTLTGSLPNLEAGMNGEIRFALTNNSLHVANDVIVTMAGGFEDIFRPTTISAGMISLGTIRIGNTNSKLVSIPVIVFDDAKEGYYTISLRVTMVNAAGSSIEQMIDIQVFIKNPKSNVEPPGMPSLTMTSAIIDNNIPPDDGVIELTLAIANKGDGDAAEAMINLTGFNNSEISLNESIVTKPLGSIAAGSSIAVSYSLKVAGDLPAGSYPLTVEVKYRLPDGTEETMLDTAYINIIRTEIPAVIPQQSNMQLIGVSQDVSDPGSANIINVTLTIQNKNDIAAQDVSVGFSGLSSSSFTLSGDFGERELGIMEPGGTESTTVPLYVSESLPNGNYPLIVQIRCSNPDPEAESPEKDMVEIEVYVFVNRPEKVTPSPTPPPTEDVNNSVPRVIINRHSISVDNVVAGSPFELSVTLLNTSSNKNVKNMKVTVTDKDGIFIPVEGVNSFYIADLPIGQTTDIAITLAPKQDAETKSYPVSISLDYEDEKSVAYSVTESLSIPVYLPQRLEIMNVMFYEDGAGMAFLSFQFINKGKAPLYNMNIRVEGPMTAMEGDYYIGTFGPGQSDYFEDTIIPQQYGELSGDIVLEFEDSAGTQQELRSPLFAFINEPYWSDDGFVDDGMWPMDPGFPIDDGQGGEGGFLRGWLTGWMIWVIIGGVIVIGGIVAIIIVKKVKRSKIETELDFNE